MKTATWLRGRLLGRGSFGGVSLAFRSPSGEAFAVKSVGLSSCSPDSVRSLENEIAILSSLYSPYVVEYLGDDETWEPGLGPCRNLHVEYMPGGTAADLAAAGRGEAEVRDCARCVARALSYLHGVAGVVHCDVKGRNVLLGRSTGIAKLADFGAALRIYDADAVEEKNEWLRGTPLWMAPEVVRGERPTPASDIWSLGCTIIEMASGARPWSRFGRGDATAVMFEIGYGYGLPEFPEHLSKVGWDFLDKCLRRNAEERWTAEQLLQHPFLAEDSFVAAASTAWKSPRCVLDWANSKFSDDDAGEICSTSYAHVSVSSASERVRRLASQEEGILGWDTADWEVVRCAGEPNLVRNQEQDQQPQQCSSRCNGEQRDLVNDEFVLSIATSCSASSFRHCCSGSSYFFYRNKQEGLLLLHLHLLICLELSNLFLILIPLYFIQNFSGKFVRFNTVSCMLLCSAYFDLPANGPFFLQQSKNRARQEETCEDSLKNALHVTGHLIQEQSMQEETCYVFL